MLVGEDLHLDVLGLDQILSSMKMLSSPKALRASLLTSSKAGPTSSSVWHRRMPRPPPPAAALRMTGKPNSCALASASAASRSGSRVPGDDRYAARHGDLLGFQLVAHFGQHVGWGGR